MISIWQLGSQSSQGYDENLWKRWARDWQRKILKYWKVFLRSFRVAATAKRRASLGFPRSTGTSWAEFNFHWANSQHTNKYRASLKVPILNIIGSSSGSHHCETCKSLLPAFVFLVFSNCISVFLKKCFVLVFPFGKWSEVKWSDGSSVEKQPPLRDV